MRRRTALASLGTVVAATASGCTQLLPTKTGSSSEGDASGRGAATISLYNTTSEQVTLSVEATNANDGTTRIDRTLDIESHGKRRIRNEVFYNRDYEVTVSNERGYSETATWKDAEGGLQILIQGGDDDTIVFAEKFA